MIKVSHQTLFWILVFIFLNTFFGIRWDSYTNSFYYTSMLMPVAIGTSYFFNLLLVPKYLNRGKHLRFVLYTLYSIIVSIFLSALIAMLSFIVLVDLNWNQMNPVVTDLFQMGIIIYFIAMLFSFIQLYNSNRQHQKQISVLEKAYDKTHQKTISVRSNRKTISVTIEDILYIESLADYVKIHTVSDVIVTKERISILEESLPEWFIRAHRSFLVNRRKLKAYGHDFVQVNSEKLPLGRKYKNEALTKIRLSQVNQ